MTTCNSQLVIPDNLVKMTDRILPLHGLEFARVDTV